MKKFSSVFVIGLLCFIDIFAQKDTSNMVKFTHDFRFLDGVYMSFNEFKNNEPAVKTYEYIENKNSREKGNYTIRYIDTDSTGKSNTKAASRCFGFSRNGVFYFNNGNSGFYRMFIIGALSHILWYERQVVTGGDYMSTGLVISSTIHNFKEYLLDFESGEKFLFTYKKFRDFLRMHDAEMLKELEKSKNKRKMIHRFLLEYNEKHPVYFPVKK